MASIEERVSRLEGGYDHLATKADISELKGELKADIADLRGERRMFALAITAGLLSLAALQVALKYAG